jgi:hypothetical protein
MISGSVARTFGENNLLLNPFCSSSWGRDPADCDRPSGEQFHQVNFAGSPSGYQMSIAKHGNAMSQALGLLEPMRNVGFLLF